MVGTTGRIESTWGNAIRDRTVQNFATAAARDAAIPSPVVGQLCVIDNDAVATLALQQYVGATDGWRGPWNLPWGRMTVATTTSASSNSASTTLINSGLTTSSFAVVTNRILRTTVRFHGISTVADDKISTLVTDGGGGGIEGRFDFEVADTFAEGQQYSVEETSAAGSITRKLMISRSSGTGNVRMFADATRIAKIWVDDMGPAGAPA